MEDRPIDLEKVIENLQHENETLRENLAHIKLEPSWFKLFTRKNVYELVEHPYFLIGLFAGCIWMFLAIVLFAVGRTI